VTFAEVDGRTTLSLLMQLGSEGSDEGQANTDRARHRRRSPGTAAPGSGRSPCAWRTDRSTPPSGARDRRRRWHHQPVASRPPGSNRAAGSARGYSADGYVDRCLRPLGQSAGSGRGSADPLLGRSGPGSPAASAPTIPAVTSSSGPSGAITAGRPAPGSPSRRAGFPPPGRWPSFSVCLGRDSGRICAADSDQGVSALPARGGRAGRRGRRVACRAGEPARPRKGKRVAPRFTSDRCPEGLFAT